MAERTIRGDKIVKGQNGQYIFNPKVTGRVLEGNIFLPPDGSQVAPIEVELELTEQQYNQFKNDVNYSPYLIPITEAGKFAITAGTIDPRNGQVLNSTFGIGVDERSKELTRLLADSSREIINSTNTQFEIEGLINQSSAAVAPETGNTSAANPVDTGTTTGGTPTTGTATAGSAAGTPPGGTGTTGTPVGGVTRGQATLTDNKVTRSKGPAYIVYPADMDEAQDKIKFSLWEHKKQLGNSPNQILTTLQGSTTTAYTPEQFYKRIEGSVVYLPITKISDTNAVDWVDDSINALQLKLADLSLTAMDTNSNNVGDKFRNLMTYFGTPDMQNAIRLYFASQAVSANGLLTRATGGIFNPNLELLFNAPQLRSFTFSVGMISKNNKDAENVKKIINFFKKNMSVRTNPSNNLFLRSPYVFQIEYLTGQSTHQSLNKIKMCALQACNVDYTPMGSYMTFNDGSKTMFMYAMQLQFKELHPIYDVDYLDGHPIGY